MKPAGGIGKGAPAAPASGGQVVERDADMGPPQPVLGADGAPEHEVQELLKFKMRYGRPYRPLRAGALNRPGRGGRYVGARRGGRGGEGRGSRATSSRRAPHGGYVKAVRVGRCAREETEGAHPTRGNQQTGGEGRVFRVQQHLVPNVELHVPQGGVELRLEPVLPLLQQVASNACTSSVPRPMTVVASSPAPAGSGAAAETSGRRGCWQLST